MWRKVYIDIEYMNSEEILQIIFPPLIVAVFPKYFLVAVFSLSALVVEWRWGEWVVEVGGGGLLWRVGFHFLRSNEKNDV